MVVGIVLCFGALVLGVGAWCLLCPHFQRKWRRDFPPKTEEIPFPANFAIYFGGKAMMT